MAEARPQAVYDVAAVTLLALASAMVAAVGWWTVRLAAAGGICVPE
jgi:hypothetical protein